MDVDTAIMLYALIIKKRNKKIKKQRLLWVHPIVSQRNEKGHFQNLFPDLLQYPPKFFNYFRMSRNSFFELHDAIEYDIRKEDTNMRKSITTEERLAVTLRYLASGCTLTGLHYDYRIGVSTLSNIIQETCVAIWDNLKNAYMPEPTKEKWVEIAELYCSITNFPNCIGAIDGKHIRVVKPAHSGSLYYNYKHFFSIVLLAVCDANYCFIAVDIGDYGKNSDSSIFKNLNFYKKMIKKELSIPKDSVLPVLSVLLLVLRLHLQLSQVHHYILITTQIVSRQSILPKNHIWQLKLATRTKMFVKIS